MNGDGIPDLVVVEVCQSLSLYGVCNGSGQVNVMLGNGDGTFQSPVVYRSGGYEGSALAIADVNGDGRPDLLVTNALATKNDYNSGSVAVLLNKTSYTTKTSLTASPNPALVNQTVTLTATITSNPPVSNGETVTLLQRQGQSRHSHNGQRSGKPEHVVLQGEELYDQSQLSRRPLPQTQLGNGEAGGEPLNLPVERSD